VPWYHLSITSSRSVHTRLNQLRAIHQQTIAHSLTGPLGQCLEIAVFRALKSQKLLEYFGAFNDLDAHDDSTMYSKEEPPSTLSGRPIPGGKKLDFLIRHPQSGYAGIEVKNIRNWMYPSREEIAELILKCCALDVVPVLIARRIHYSTFSVLNPCGVILHQNFNQLYPNSAQALAEKVKNKNLLGYHDVRIGNIPDARMIRFLHENLPKVLADARARFDDFKDLLCGYANDEFTYESFAARVKRRSQGLPEDFPESEPDPSDWDLS
jgi:hypothetical protein